MAKNISTLLIKLAFKSDPSVTGKIDAVMNSISSKMARLGRTLAGSLKFALGGIARTVGNIFASITREIQSIAGQALDASMKYGVKRAEFAALFRDSGQEGTLSNDFLKKIDEFSEKTSHTTANLQKWASMLKAMGMPADHILKWLDMMGRVAGGNADVNNRMLMNIGQVFANKRAFGLDIKQFGFAGIPIKEYLAQVHSTTVARIGEMVTAGEIGYEELFNAFVKMTEVGGAYEKRMENYMKTVQGKRDILTKKYDRLLRDSGKPLERMFGHYLGKGIEFLNAMKENGALTRFFETLGDIIHIFAMTLTDVFGGQQDEAFTAMDAMGKFAKEMAMKIQMLVYLFTGIPDRYKKLGMTDSFIKKELGIHKVRKWFTDFSEELARYIREDLPQVIGTNLGIAIGKGLAWTLKAIGKTVIHGVDWLIGHLNRAIFNLLGDLLGKIPGLSMAEDFFKNLAQRQQNRLNNNPIEQGLDMAAIGFVSAATGASTEILKQAKEPYMTPDWEEQQQNAKEQEAFGEWMKNRKAGNNLSVNIYTDESRSVVAEQVQQMYGELA
tara:strand:+ start:6339 stop:8003 length:1665 start_codon:yes stop_codon:yes gene_type:complete